MRDLHNAYAVANNELWPCMLWKKLAMVKDFVIVQIVDLVRGYTQTREVWISDVIFVWETFSPSQCLCCGKILILVKYVVEKVGNGQSLWNWALSIGGGGGETHTDRGKLWKVDVNFVLETFTMPMLWQNVKCGQVCCRKSWQWSKTM